MILHSLDKYRDEGLFILRVGIGLMFIGHGLPKLMAGPEKWVMLGGAMKNLGINFAPMFWGLMATLSEFAGGILLVLGLFTRPACFFMLNTMIVATYMHISKGDPFLKYFPAMEAGILFFSLIFIGPGKYSVDNKINSNKKNR